jgi:hypothetical protein
MSLEDRLSLIPDSSESDKWSERSSSSVASEERARYNPESKNDSSGEISSIECDDDMFHTMREFHDDVDTSDSDYARDILYLPFSSADDDNELGELSFYHDFNILKSKFPKMDWLDFEKATRFLNGRYVAYRDFKNHGSTYWLDVGFKQSWLSYTYAFELGLERNPLSTLDILSKDMLSHPETMKRLNDYILGIQVYQRYQEMNPDTVVYVALRDDILESRCGIKSLYKQIYNKLCMISNKHAAGLFMALEFPERVLGHEYVRHVYSDIPFLKLCASVVKYSGYPTYASPQDAAAMNTKAITEKIYERVDKTLPGYDSLLAILRHRNPEITKAYAAEVLPDDLVETINSYTI